MDFKVEQLPSYNDICDIAYANASAPSYALHETMDLEADNANLEESNTNIDEKVNIEGTSRPLEIIATYESDKKGILKKEYTITNIKGNESYFIKIGLNKGKLYCNQNEQATMKIQRADFSLKQTRWYIDYLIKDPEIYTRMDLVHKSFYLRPSFEVKLTTYDNTLITYTWKPSNGFNTSWHMLDEHNNILLKYKYNILDKCIIEFYHHFSDNDVKIILLSLATLVTHMERKRNS